MAPPAYDTKAEIDALKASIEELKLALAETDKRASAHYKRSVWFVIPYPQNSVWFV